MTVCALCIESLPRGWEQQCDKCNRQPFLQARHFSSQVDLSEHFGITVPCQYCDSAHTDAAYRIPLDVQNKAGEARRLTRHLFSHVQRALKELPAWRLGREKANTDIVEASERITICRQEKHDVKINVTDLYLAERPRDFEQSEALFAPLREAAGLLHEAIREKNEAEKRLAKATEMHSFYRTRLKSLFALHRRLGCMYKEIKFLLLEGHWEYNEHGRIAWADVLRRYLTCCSGPHNTDDLFYVARWSRGIEFVGDGVVRGMERRMSLGSADPPSDSESSMSEEDEAEIEPIL